MTRLMWMVSHGAYSDYSVACVASDALVAQAICDRLNKAEGCDPDDNSWAYRVEEVQQLESADEVTFTTIYYAHLIYDRVRRVCEVWRTGSNVQTDFGPYTGERTNVYEHDVDHDGRHEHQVQARSIVSADHALRIASDRLAQWRAERELEAQP